jgi:exodeoxyribonuclease VII large subunit
MPDLGMPLELSVSDFVGLLNQTLEIAYPSVTITGELANLRVSKNKWVYFDLKDEFANVKFFGTVYQLPGPLEDGMLLKVRGQPRLHQLYGFSVNVISIRPAGEGTIRRAAQLLQAKLATEGLFDDSRKRPLPYPPSRIGLVTSKQSAAYADFIKVLNARWRGLAIQLVDVQVQGEPAPGQIATALEQLNSEAKPPEVIILIRGGGSAEDLAAFSTEHVTRAVAASRVPTLVAIGHEIDLSLAEMAADQRASTPSNAAELLVPDRQQVKAGLHTAAAQLQHNTRQQLRAAHSRLVYQAEIIERHAVQPLQRAAEKLQNQARILAAINPAAILRRGYAIVRRGQQPVRSVGVLDSGGIVDVQLNDGHFTATINKLRGH